MVYKNNIVWEWKFFQVYSSRSIAEDFGLVEIMWDSILFTK